MLKTTVLKGVIIIKINDLYKIETDKFNIVLLKRFKNTKEEYDYRTTGYYGTFKELYLSLLKKHIKGEELKDLETILNRIDEVENFIKEKINN